MAKGGGSAPAPPPIPEYVPPPPPTQAPVEAESAAIREDEARRQKLRRGVAANILAGASTNADTAQGMGQTLLGKTQ